MELVQNSTVETPNDDLLVIANRSFQSRLFIGTGKFSSPEALRATIRESGSEVVTVALRRVDIRSPQDATLRAIDGQAIQLLPNTSGARDAEEAIRVARLCRKISGNKWVKLEVTPDPASLLPDPIETLKAAKTLVQEGFVVLPYINADLILAKYLEDAGCATVMPLGAPIGTNRGIRTRDAIAMIVDAVRIPVVVDAGLGAPSHAAEAMELGADAVLVNTALATAQDPAVMARAFRLATEAGRLGYLAGTGAVATKAQASSPLTGFLHGDTEP